MAFSGGQAGKPLSPFTISQPVSGQPPPATSTASFTFGAGTATGFNFGGGGQQLGGAAPTGTGGTGFTFGGGGGGGIGGGGPPPPFSFGGGQANIAGSNSAPQLSFSTATSAPTAPQLSFSASTGAPPPPLISFVPPTPAPSATSILGTGGTEEAKTTAQPPASQPAIPASTTAQPPAAPQSIIPPSTTSQPTPGQPAAAQAPTSQPSAAQSTAAAATNVSQINFRQLQEAINKWMLDLQDQEKLFLEEATRVNAWDRTLIINGDKIAKLNESVTKVKNDHSRLEHALEYIKTQQQEFENFLEPLEAGLPVNIPVEPEREQLYTLTETVDTQLQQMTEDLKEVIRHINEANKTVDKNDPISQILRILNEHMDALHWVEDNTNQIKRSMEDVSRQHQTAKKEHERSLRNMFK